MSEENEIFLFPDTRTCFHIPIGRKIRLVFPQKSLTESCVCSITNRPDAEAYFLECNCIANNCTNLEFNFSRDSESICLTGGHLDSKLNRSLILFEEENNSCSSRFEPYLCSEHNILSIYRIIIPGEDARHCTSIICDNHLIHPALVTCN